MLRKRLIFSLIYSNGFFTQSRNFRLQKVGDFDWLDENYKFQKIANSLDELVILNASRDARDFNNFCKNVKKLAKMVFIPISAGGQVRNIDDIELLFNSGADKIIFNSKIFRDPNFVRNVSKRYGASSIVASIDYKWINNDYNIFINQGMFNTKLNIRQYISKFEELEVGEIYLNSIDRDGTGFGYDLSPFYKKEIKTKIPIILAGGAGKAEHLKEGLQIPEVSAVATANLFNFMGSALIDSREHLLNQNQNLASWENMYEYLGT